ncbi:hypothetical protein [Streptomyces sp. NPDC001843]
MRIPGSTAGRRRCAVAAARQARLPVNPGAFSAPEPVGGIATGGGGRRR